MGVDELFKTSSTPITYYQNSIKFLLLQRITQRYQVQKGRIINTHYLLSKLYIVFTFTAYNSKMSSIERANHQHPTPNTQHLSAHQHLTLNTFHPTLRSLKLAEEAGIVLREEAEIAYTILEVSNTLNTHTEGITCIYA